MKVKVKISFIDKHTNVVHKVGEVFEADDARVAEIKNVNPDLIEVQKSASVSESEKSEEEEVKKTSRRKKKVGAINE